MRVVHGFTSAKVASADATRIDGPKWNADHTLTGAAAPSQGGTGIANNDSSTIAISGSFGTTFTVTATTALTLPTTGTLATTSNTLGDFAATTSAQLAGTISDETGTGALVFANAPSLIAPALGTPASGVATNLTGTASGLTAGHVTTNANLTGPITSVGNATSIASQTGTGSKFVVDTSPTLVTPVLGAASATSINKVAITAPATAATLTILNNKTATINNTITFAGTDATTITFQGTDTYIGRATTDTLTNKTFDTAGIGNSFSINGVAATANTGTGAVARAVSPAFTTPTLGVATATTLNGNTFTTGTYTLTGTAGKTFTFSNTLTVTGTDGSSVAFGTGGTIGSVGYASVGQIPGETSTGSASAGNVGQIISSAVALASAVSLVATTATNITSISLTAGDWDVSAVFYNTVQAPFSAVTTWSYTRGSISTTSATMDFTAGSFLAYPALGSTASSDFAIGIPPIRISLSATTTVYLVEQVNYTGGSVGGFGMLKARRVR